MRMWLSAVLLLALLPSAAAAQDLEALITAAKAERFGDAYSFAGAAANRGNRGGTIVTFYFSPRPGRSTGWVARRVNMVVRNAPPVVSWAECAAVDDIVVKLENVEPSRLSVRGGPSGLRPPPPPDSASYRVWSNHSYQATVPGDTGAAQFSGYLESPVGVWFGEMERALQTCWRAEAPAARP